MIGYKSLLAFLKLNTKGGEKLIDSVRAILERVVLEGAHGSFAIATTRAFTGSIAFSLERNVWQE